MLLPRHTLGKDERLCSLKLIEALFKGGASKAMTAFPLRMIYLIAERDNDDAPPARVMFGVPKRCLRQAVMRNRVKRQMREAYRLNKQLLYDSLALKNEQTVTIALIWLDTRLHSSVEVHGRVRRLLTRLSEKL